MSYEKGNKVIVKENLTIGRPYGNAEFVIAMAEFDGEEVTIAEVLPTPRQYKIEEDNKTYTWHEKMFVKP